MNKEIFKLIKKSKKDFDKSSQRAELLARNKSFKKELAAISSRLGEDFFKDLEKRIQKEKEKGLPDYIPKELYDLREEWFSFCDRWHISYDWDRKINSLNKFIGKTVAIVDDIDTETYEGMLYLRIDAWTTLEDIHAIWPEIEKRQKKYFVLKAEKRINFGRDLCWYDLHKKYKLSHREIAKLWEEKYPEDIDLLVIKRIKQISETMRDIKEYIKKEQLKELEGRELDDQELLREIKAGKLAKAYRAYFDDEREFYATGKTSRGKLMPPFVEMIKQAVIRIQKYINNIDLKTEFDLYDLLHREKL